MPRKSALKKKSESLDIVDAPSEAAANPTEFITIQELMQQGGLAFAMAPPEEGEEEEPEVDESPNWNVSIEGLPEMEAGGAKFSVFTTGEASSGQMVIEFKSRPGVNRNLFSWLTKPSERSITMTVDDHEGNRIESWRMKGVPVALAVDELDRECKDPWYTTFQVTVKDIQIT
jgi:hypothetical protein